MEAFFEENEQSVNRQRSWQISLLLDGSISSLQGIIDGDHLSLT